MHIIYKPLGWCIKYCSILDDTNTANEIHIISKSNLIMDPHNKTHPKPRLRVIYHTTYSKYLRLKKNVSTTHFVRNKIFFFFIIVFNSKTIQFYLDRALRKWRRFRSRNLLDNIVRRCTCFRFRYIRNRIQELQIWLIYGWCSGDCDFWSLHFVVSGNLNNEKLIN